MLKLTLRFFLMALLLLTASRLGLSIWQWDRVQATDGLAAIMLGGLRMDLSILAMLCGFPLLLAPWLGHMRSATWITAWWYRLAWLVLVLLELATPQFITEYDTRPNRLFIIYLTNPHEVISMLWHGYKLMVALVLVGLIAIVWGGWKQLPVNRPDRRLPWLWRVPSSLLLFLLAVVVARGTLAHRPLNAAMVAVGNDGMVNALPLNSFRTVADAIERLGDEHPAAELYGDMPEARMQDVVRESAGWHEPMPDATRPTLHWQQASRTPDHPLNIVIIVEESLGAQYVSSLGGQDLTPELDALGQQGWWFERLYATGTRSARGLEAIATGFPPSPAESVLKLPRSQQNFFTLAELLGREGYVSRFIYGGEAHFDNMKGFFLGNGFDTVIDRPEFQTTPTFVGTWGVADEDMFNELDHRLQQDEPGKPTFTLAFSVSNHTPWQYPEGRIDATEPADTVENTVRYADWALGQFFQKARQSTYWENTLFLIVADHDARVFGADLIPVQHFHIPGLILGAGITPQQDTRLISQIDLAPTLLSLAGISSQHPMIGADLTQRDPNRAIMQYGDHYGYLADDQLVVLAPHADPRQFTVNAGKLQATEPDATLTERAQAHVLWSSWAYLNQRYSLPPTNAATDNTKSED